MLFRNMNTSLCTTTRSFYDKTHGPARRVQAADMFAKVLNKSLSKKRSRYISPAVGTPSMSLETIVTSLTASRAPIRKRADVLNKLFMRSITDVLSTGELSEDVLNYDVQISQVRVGADFNVVNAFWVPKGTDNDAHIQKELDQVAHPLRHCLSQLRIVGNVPPIQFVKDKHYAFAAEVERRLRLCGFNEKNSNDEMEQLKKEFTLQISLPREVREKISEVEQQIEYTEEEESLLPPMAMNVMELDYDKIMKKIKSNNSVPGKTDVSINLVFENNKSIPQYLYDASKDGHMNAKDLKRFIRNKKIDAMKMHYENCKRWKLETMSTNINDSLRDDDVLYDDLIREFLYEDYLDDFTQEEEYYREECRQ